MVNAHDGVLYRGRLPGPGQTAQLVLLPGAQGDTALPAAGARAGHPRAARGYSSLLRLPADPCAAQAAGDRLQPQDGLASDAAPGLALHQPVAGRALYPEARGAGASRRTEPAWASDITSIRAWDGQKGRLAVILDCADRNVLAWRFAKRISAEDLAELLREALFRRFGEARSAARGLEFLSDNGPEYTSHRFRPVVQALGLIPCHTPRRSPESNGLAEAFFGSLKRDYVYQACLDTLEETARQVPGWIADYNQQAPHSALGMCAPAQFYAEWLVKQQQVPVQN